ncbi:MAG: ABC transporter ATP-binding protein [Anaerovoracaceae bacterium]
MAELKILNLKKEYEKGKTAVDDFTLTIRDGELAVIVGPSGCGKSTTLRMIAGLVPATSGRIILDGRDISEVSTRERDIAMVFQNYALYENMTVFGNIAFPLKIRKEEKEKIREKVTGISKILKIEDLLDRRPKTLSGGEKQRVAMGRALVRNPKLFLMDEPRFP